MSNDTPAFDMSKCLDILPREYCRKFQVFKCENFILFHTDYYYYMLEIIYFMFIIKQHIFYDTYTVFLIYDEIEQKKWIGLGHNT